MVVVTSRLELEDFLKKRAKYKKIERHSNSKTFGYIYHILRYKIDLIANLLTIQPPNVVYLLIFMQFVK